MKINILLKAIGVATTLFTLVIGGFWAFVWVAQNHIEYLPFLVLGLMFITVVWCAYDCLTEQDGR